MDYDSRFYCTQCGKEGIPVPRELRSLHESGHLKKIYCVYCDKINNAVEIRPKGKYTYSDFLWEFEESNFDKAGNRIIPFNQFKNKRGGINEKELQSDT